MHAARYNSNPEMTSPLLKAGADAKAKDSSGQTALDYAKNNYSLKGTDALKQLEEASRFSRRVSGENGSVAAQSERLRDFFA